MRSIREFDATVFDPERPCLDYIAISKSFIHNIGFISTFFYEKIYLEK